MREELTWFIAPGLKECGHQESFMCACIFYGEGYHQDRHVYETESMDPAKIEYQHLHTGDIIWH